MSFVVKKRIKCTDSITRTIRFKGNNYDAICIIAEENDITFNNVVNQMIEYALDNKKE